MRKALLRVMKTRQQRKTVPVRVQRAAARGARKRPPGVAGTALAGLAEDEEYRCLFDPEEYLRQNPDVAAAGMDPFLHYLQCGRAEGRNPHPLFDAGWYVARNPDVAAEGIDPVLHYLRRGGAEGRDPHPLFDSDWYLERNPDVALAGTNPLVHYLCEGAAQGRDPNPIFDAAAYIGRHTDNTAVRRNPLLHFLQAGIGAENPGRLFDCGWYLERNPHVADMALNPLVHYLRQGAFEGRDPHPLFDSAWYLARNPDVMQFGVIALVHYLRNGAFEGRDPHPLFDSAWYLQRHPGVAAARINPLVHYVSAGVAEGADPNPIFNTNWYLARHPDIAATGVHPLVHFLQNGVNASDPGPLFDSDWYMERNPDVAAAGINPLIHYLQTGAAEGRDPHPLFDSAWYIQRVPESAANPLAHYLWQGRARKIAPHRLFDIAFYLSANPDVAELDREPVDHYLEQGAAQGRNPNPLFDSAWYMAAYPELADIGINPLVQYVLTGASEGRDPSPHFNTAWYWSNNRDIVPSGLNPLAHFLRYGSVEGRKPIKPATRSSQLPMVSTPAAAREDYADWCSRHDAGVGLLALQQRQSRALAWRPCISLIVPVYKIELRFMQALIESIQLQSYSHWEICIALGWLEDIELAAYLQAAAAADSRIRLVVLAENLGISGNSNAALELAGGEYVGLLDHDDTLAPDALFEVACLLNEQPATDFIYTDKDTMDANGARRFNPLFKPAWSPELMLSINYLTHFNVLRTSRVREIGGWDAGTDGAQDWDLFLRFIGGAQVVRHIARPLYHWRILPTSVASGLGAKPWAAAAQLRTLDRYLRNNGWPGAAPRFVDENVIRVEWAVDYRPRLLIIVVAASNSSASPGDAAAAAAKDEYGAGVTIRRVQAGAGLVREVAEHVACVDAEILVFLDAHCTPQTGWLGELIGPLQNTALAAVGGRLQDATGLLREGAFVFTDGMPSALFAGVPDHAFGIFGAPCNYRNCLAVSGSLMAVRRTAWDLACGFSENPAWGRVDIDLGVRISALGTGRIMLNTYARAAAAHPSIFERHGVEAADSASFFADRFSGGDPFFHPSLHLVLAGEPALRPGPPAVPHQHDYAAEARHCAAQYDAPAASFAKAGDTFPVPSATIRRMAWFVPGFNVPFYGGVHTILRTAEYLRCHRAVQPIFVVLGAPDAGVMRATIARAFPELAEHCEIVVVNDVRIAPDLVVADAAVATLWTTAYAVRLLQTVHSRFYFMQDYEPLFYPAGTTAALVQATYRFGFHAICNTISMRLRYEAHGGHADHFVPAVAAETFHARGRQARQANHPFLIFSYARPGHPRNCFEVVTAGLAELKRRMGRSVQILSAGADWDPRAYGLGGVIENLGLLSYNDTGKLYRAIDLGVVAMATPHPSYLPLEMMACGALVATNHNPDTAWLLRDGENCVLFDLTQSAIADTVERIFADPVRFAEITANACRTIASNHNDWDRVGESIANAMLGHLNTGAHQPAPRKGRRR
jgi:cellulose synthase/poly-beta-1,6-N-acetylglucosamine synthase-like glycosyltransferase/glycosyltransferase involved in cell wall biosynthesis